MPDKNDKYRNLSELEKQIVELVEELGPITARDIHDKLTPIGGGNAEIYSCLHRLGQSGKLIWDFTTKPDGTSLTSVFETKEEDAEPVKEVPGIPSVFLRETAD